MRIFQITLLACLFVLYGHVSANQEAVKSDGPSEVEVISEQISKDNASQQGLSTNEADAIEIAVEDESYEEKNSSKPFYQQVKLSPDGQYFAALALTNNTYNLAVFQREDITNAHYVTNFEQYDIISFQWVNSDYLVFSYGEVASAPGLYSVHRSGEESIYTIGAGYINSQGKAISAKLIDVWPDKSDQIIVSYNRRQDSKADLYKVRVSDGKLLETIERHGGTKWWFDVSGEMRLLLKDNDNSQSLSYIENDELHTVIKSANVENTLSPLSIVANSNNAWVMSRTENQQQGLYLYDWEKAKFIAQVEEAKNKSIGSVLMNYNRKQLLAAIDSQGEQIWIEPKEKEFNQLILQLFPRHGITELSRSNDGRWRTIQVRDEQDGVRYYLVDRVDRKVSLLFMADDEKGS